MRKDTGIDFKRIGKRIQRRREEMDVTQEELAETLDASRNHISTIENGKCKITIDVLIMICRKLRVTPDYFLLGTTHEYNPAKDIEDSLLLCTKEDLILIRDFIEMLIERHNRTDSEKKQKKRAAAYKAKSRESKQNNAVRKN